MAKYGHHGADRSFAHGNWEIKCNLLTLLRRSVLQLEKFLCKINAPLRTLTPLVWVRTLVPQAVIRLIFLRFSHRTKRIGERTTDAQKSAQRVLPCRRPYRLSVAPADLSPKPRGSQAIAACSENRSDAAW
jgi:hypothetical protein